MINKIELQTGFRAVPRTGVIYVMTEAKAHGYSPDDANWVNLGQGAPETTPLPGAPSRITRIDVEESALEYAPIDGIMPLREAVAELYNKRYRQGKKSRYTAENVSICSGGRLALTRVVSTLGRTNVGHFLPDYTAYEELLDTFSTFVPIPLQLKEELGYEIPLDDLRDLITGMGLSTLLISNPCNPSGTVIQGETLKGWVETARELDCAMIFDEFYAHYLYENNLYENNMYESNRAEDLNASLDSPTANTEEGDITPTTLLSAAEFIQDVNRDPIVIIDGLTKNWRYPGFRISWTLAPKKIIEGIASSGSFLDGGAAHPLQMAAIKLVKRCQANQEAQAIQKIFGEKRDFLLRALLELGIEVACPPKGSFYIWANVKNLPTGINTGTSFFQAGLEHGLITVPGVFFDINPGHRRPDKPSRFLHHVRFSFGPAMAELQQGVEKIREMIAQHSV